MSIVESQQQRLTRRIRLSGVGFPQGWGMCDETIRASKAPVEAELERGIVEPEELTRRLKGTAVGEPVRARIAGKIKVWTSPDPQ